MLKSCEVLWKSLGNYNKQALTWWSGAVDFIIQTIDRKRDSVFAK